MYCSRPVARSSPSVVRIVRPAAAARSSARQASFLAPPFFHRFPGSAALTASNDFAPFFRLFDDLTSSAVPQLRNNTFAYQPRFDVREVGDAYELRGELPGVEGKDIEVEFTDPQTLVIRGRTEKETTSGTPPTTTTAAAVESAPEAESTNAVAADAAADNSDAASTYSTGSYQKPSVEDEAGEGTAGQATPAESTVEEAKEPEQAKAPVAEQQQPQSRYWVSERSTGSFQRVFNFPARVDTEAVKASLKNGILSIAVPKAAAPAAKKIDIE